MRWIAMMSLMFIFIQPVSATLKKCVDDLGMYHYYDKVLPLECHGKTTIVMNKLGVVIKRNIIKKTRKTTDLEALKSANARKRKETQRDTVLLNIYTGKAEIDLARTRNIQPVKLAITGIKKRLDITHSQLKSLQKQAEIAKRSKSSILAAIQEDMIPIKRKATNLQNELNTNQKRIQHLHAKFDADKKRFMELMKNNQ